MNLILIVIVLLLLFGGGGWYGHSSGYFSGNPVYFGGFGIGGLILLILVLYLLGVFR